MFDVVWLSDNPEVDERVVHAGSYAHFISQRMFSVLLSVITNNVNASLATSVTLLSNDRHLAGAHRHFIFELVESFMCFVLHWSMYIINYLLCVYTFSPINQTQLSRDMSVFLVRYSEGLLVFYGDFLFDESFKEEIPLKPWVVHDILLDP